MALSDLPNLSFAPMARNGHTSGVAGASSDAPLQEAVQLLRLTMPRIVGARAMSPQTLLTSPGSAGLGAALAGIGLPIPPAAPPHSPVGMGQLTPNAWVPPMGGGGIPRMVSGGPPVNALEELLRRLFSAQTPSPGPSGPFTPPPPVIHPATPPTGPEWRRRFSEAEWPTPSEPATAMSDLPRRQPLTGGATRAWMD